MTHGSTRQEAGCRYNQGVKSEFPHGAGCIGCDSQFASGLTARLRRRHASVVGHIDDSVLNRRVKAGLCRALSRGITSRAAVSQFVVLMFTLEPDFDRRFRVRERLCRETSLDEGILKLPFSSHPNCWYRADAAVVERAWQSMSGDADCLHHPAINESSGSGSDEIVPAQLSDGYGFQLDVPYAGTPDEVVQLMLQIAQVGPSDTVMDLGSGDGRIVIAAAQRFGARGIGVDINPEHVERGRYAAESAGVSGRVRFVRADLFDIDISEATVVTLYLLRHVNLELRDRLRNELRPGSRVVSRQFDMGDWEPRAQFGESADRIYCWSIDH